MTDILQQNKAIVYRFNKEFIEGGNLDVAEQLVADDFINHTAPSGTANDRTGVINFIANVLRPAMPDIRVEIHQQVAEGDLVVTRKSFTAMHTVEFLGLKPSGEKITIRVIDIIRLRDGKFVEHWSIRDMQQAD